MSDIGLLIYGIAGLMMSILSGATGGGGGFVMTPLAIFLGLSPAQAVANGKFAGLFVTIGSLAGLRSHKVSNRRITITLTIMAVVAGFVASRVIVSIDSQTYERVLGVLLIATAPIIVYRKIGHKSKEMSKAKEVLGFTFVATSMLIVGIFSSGLGIFINISMMSFLGLNSLDASVIKRYAQLFLNTTIIISLIGAGLFFVNVILVGLVSGVIGGFIGGKVAIKKGSSFVSTLIAIAAFGSGIWLLV